MLKQVESLPRTVQVVGSPGVVSLHAERVMDENGETWPLVLAETPETLKGSSLNLSIS